MYSNLICLSQFNIPFRHKKSHKPLSLAFK
nr:MAG TPA: hypothetical protein [Caudoviricetes sp.]